MTDNVLYSFRRCPYAIRARLAIKSSGTRVELREVVLRDKPPSMLQASAKATVPVLLCGDGTVIDESLDIMLWALRQHDPGGWLAAIPAGACTTELIAACDGPFKQALDRYKYADRHPQHAAAFYRAEAEPFVARLEQRLHLSRYLCGQRPGYDDMAILPFIRQFAAIDRAWFDQACYRATRRWLDQLLATPLFAGVMQKYPPWKEGTRGVPF
jgi:glutathione S-transferase